ncbi:hypothetical protein DFP74_0576 [Nocardiopsis sp. Huas11]|nr:hypothetical protein DFP74_0576 [Nocardiopsis sp. Huas11]
MRHRHGKPLRRTRIPAAAHQVRKDFEDARWEAAQHGLILTRARRLLGAVYTLVSLDGEAVILYDLRELREYLDRLDPPSIL